MRPLQSVAMGLVVVVLSARFGGYDALADPLGWLLVLIGVRRLPAGVQPSDTLMWLAGLAGLVSLPLWLPAVADAVDDAGPSLTWAVSLPQLAFTAVLCRALAGAARDAGDRSPERWLGVAFTTTVAVALLPVLVFGAGVEALETPSYVAAGLSVLLVISLAFTYSARPWALGATAAAPG